MSRTCQTKMGVNNYYNTKNENLKDKTHSFEVEDVFRYGSIEKALIMKEIKSISLYKIRHGKNGWVYYSTRALAQKFPYMSEKSIWRWLLELERDGHLLSKIENKFKYDKTKSYLPKEFEKFSKDNEKDEENETGGVLSQNEKVCLKMRHDIPQNEATIPSHTSHTEIYKTSQNIPSLREEHSFSTKQPIAFNPFDRISSPFIKSGNITIFICPLCKNKYPENSAIQISPTDWLCFDCYRKRREKIKRSQNQKNSKKTNLKVDLKRVMKYKEKTDGGFLDYKERNKINERVAKLERKMKSKKSNN